MILAIIGGFLIAGGIFYLVGLYCVLKYGYR